MNIIKIISEKLTQNNYLITNENDAILIDGSAEISQVEENLKVFNPKPKLRAVFLTHEHFDHILKVDNLIEKYHCDVYIHEFGRDALYNTEKNMSIIVDVPFRINSENKVKTFVDGEEFDFGNIHIKCLHTPGHSKGSSCFIIDDNMFTGDTIFKMGVGRTDMFGGSEETLRASLNKIISNFENVNTFYSGHGSNASRQEIEYNLSHVLGEV